MLPSILVIPPSVVKHFDWNGYFGFPGASPNLRSGSLPLSSNANTFKLQFVFHEFYDKSAFSRHTTLKNWEREKGENGETENLMGAFLNSLQKGIVQEDIS